MDNFKRREVIKLSALGFAGIALQLNTMTVQAQRANAHFGKWNASTQLNWDAFLERLTRLAKRQHQSRWNQKRYTRQVKQLLLQCDFPEFENVKLAFDNYENKQENWFEHEMLHHEIDFQVSLFQFEKGEYISHHDHPNMTGVLNVVAGNLLAKNYNIEEQLDSTRKVVEGDYSYTMKKCILHEVGNEILRAGDIGILTAEEANIHSIMPNEFTQMVDIFTPAYQEDTIANWYSVNEDGFYKGQKNRYEAEYAVSL